QAYEFRSVDRDAHPVEGKHRPASGTCPAAPGGPHGEPLGHAIHRDDGVPERLRHRDLREPRPRRRPLSYCHRPRSRDGRSKKIPYLVPTSLSTLSTIDRSRTSSGVTPREIILRST